MKKATLALAVASLLAAPAAFAGFVNGGFEDGSLNGWTSGGGSWYGSPALPVNPATYNGGPSNNTVTNVGGIDAISGAATTYTGQHAVRVNDSFNNYSVSTLRQSVAGYADNSIFFAWNAVMESSHGTADSDYFSLTLTDDTAGTTLVSRIYSSATAPGVFTNLGNGWFTSGWTVESIDMTTAGAGGTSIVGHDITLTLLASDCPYGGHAGYVYLDGFGAVIPPNDTGVVPAPATLALMGLGMTGLAAARRRKA